jgi:hypothetical protein
MTAEHMILELGLDLLNLFLQRADIDRCRIDTSVILLTKGIVNHLCPQAVL